jgi:hypothetical protein
MPVLPWVVDFGREPDLTSSSTQNVMKLRTGIPATSDSKIAHTIWRFHPTPNEQADLSVYGVPTPIKP